MRITHLSWEYPPLVYGGLGRHVHALAEAQAALGHEVSVITQATEGAPADSVAHGVRVLRVEHDPPALPFDEDHLLAWVMGLESSMTRAGISQLSTLRPEVLHAHDWIVSHAALALRTASRALDPRVALVATIHATEAGRHQGWLPSSLSHAIHSVEWWLAHEADRLIACSAHMRWEVARLFGLEESDIDVIPNGIDLRRWTTNRRAVEAARARYASTGPLVVFCGRLEWEKGAHTLIDALPRLRRRMPGLRAVIAGRGGAAENLERQAKARRVGSIVHFTGWLAESDLHALMAAADVVVVPSIYEPFGLVALEGAALGAPLVVARTGGLAEFVHDDRTGRTFAPGDPVDLARAVTDAVLDPAGSTAMARRARQRLRESHMWETIAEVTDEVYRHARATPSQHQPGEPIIPATGENLLRDSGS